jgi:hypothetical protein
MFVVTLPFGLQLVVKTVATGGKINNVDPRKQAAQLAATNPLFGRLAVRSIISHIECRKRLMLNLFEHAERRKEPI